MAKTSPVYGSYFAPRGLVSPRQRQRRRDDWHIALAVRSPHVSRKTESSEDCPLRCPDNVVFNPSLMQYDAIRTFQNLNGRARERDSQSKVRSEYRHGFITITMIDEDTNFR